MGARQVTVGTRYYVESERIREYCSWSIGVRFACWIRARVWGALEPGPRISEHAGSSGEATDG